MFAGAFAERIASLFGQQPAAAEAKHADPPAGPAAVPATGPGAASAEVQSSRAALLDHWADGPAAENDNEAAAARAYAEKLLGDKFSIVKDKLPEQAPNAVTAEEYAALVAQFADIYRGKSDIQFSNDRRDLADAPSFKDDMMVDLAAILQSVQGRELISRLHDNVLRDDAGNPLDPETGEPVRPGQEATHRTTKLIPSRRESDAQCSFGDTFEDVKNGWNPKRGANSRVRYKPGASINTTRSDVILFHEMRHALDATSGRLDESLVGDDSSVVADRGHKIKQAEHQAVGLGRYAGYGINENSYRKDRAAIGAAGGPGVLPGDLGMVQREQYSGVMP